MNRSKRINRDDDGGVKVLPGYIRQLIEAYGQGAIPPGSISTCIVRHDDWCRLLNGRGKCDCNPTLEQAVKP